METASKVSHQKDIRLVSVSPTIKISEQNFKKFQTG